MCEYSIWLPELLNYAHGKYLKWMLTPALKHWLGQPFFCSENANSLVRAPVEAAVWRETRASVRSLFIETMITPCEQKHEPYFYAIFDIMKVTYY